MYYTTKTYKHIDLNERFLIERLLLERESLRRIASILKRSISSIAREIKRNLSLKGLYNAKLANKKANKRKSHKYYFQFLDYEEFSSHFNKIYKKDYCGVEVTWQIIKRNYPNLKIPSVKQIYNWINSGNWILKRSQILKKRYVKGGRGHKRMVYVIHAKHRLPFWTRPETINDREVFGHWEADLLIGKKAKGYDNLVVMTERKTRTIFITKVRSKKPRALVRAIRYLKHKYNLDIKSITTDNGVEFKHMGLLAYQLKIKAFYCEPYASHQRGSNENANGLIRRKYKKGTDFNLVSEADLECLMDEINNMPRKLFNWKSAIEIYSQEIQQRI